jgi:hypothetical protein
VLLGESQGYCWDNTYREVLLDIFKKEERLAQVTHLLYRAMAP